MSGLRFFSDMMHEHLAQTRMLTEIKSRAEQYRRDCEIIRQQSGPKAHRGRLSPQFHAATEGICATTIILHGEPRP